jgi:hypothetical protein
MLLKLGSQLPSKLSIYVICSCFKEKFCGFPDVSWDITICITFYIYIIYKTEILQLKALSSH